MDDYVGKGDYVASCPVEHCITMIHYEKLGDALITFAHHFIKCHKTKEADV